MKFSISVLVTIVLAASTLSTILPRVEGEVTNVPAKVSLVGYPNIYIFMMLTFVLQWLSIEHEISKHAYISTRWAAQLSPKHTRTVPTSFRVPASVKSHL
jgi:hypothetical protein